VKEHRLGDLYLNIVESKNRDDGGFERQSVVLFAEDLQEFLGGFDRSLQAMQKADVEKRRPLSRRTESERPAERSRDSGSGESRQPWNDSRIPARRRDSGSGESRQSWNESRSPDRRRDGGSGESRQPWSDSRIPERRRDSGSGESRQPWNDSRIPARRRDSSSGESRQPWSDSRIPERRSPEPPRRGPGERVRKVIRKKRT
jgi:hypothetical protein